MQQHPWPKPSQGLVVQNTEGSQPLTARFLFAGHLTSAGHGISLKVSQLPHATRGLSSTDLGTHSGAPQCILLSAFPIQSVHLEFSSPDRRELTPYFHHHLHWTRDKLEEPRLALQTLQPSVTEFSTWQGLCVYPG